MLVNDLIKEKEVIYMPTVVVGDGYVHSWKALLGEKMDIRDPNKSVVEEKKDYLKGRVVLENLLIPHK